MELNVGQIVEGKVTGITNFGVFADLGEGKSGLVHISEVARSYVNDINEYVKINDVIKMKVLSISDDGKISLSIRGATDSDKSDERRERREKKTTVPTKPDGSYTWMPKKAEPANFEEMMSRFKATSDEKFSDLKRKNPEVKRSKRGAMR